MKTFVYTIVKSRHLNSGGRKQEVWIYRMKYNRPIYVCDVVWNTAGFKGEDSAVMNALARNGYIPKKFEGGYYAQSSGNFCIYSIG